MLPSKQVEHVFCFVFFPSCVVCDSAYLRSTNMPFHKETIHPRNLIVHNVIIQQDGNLTCDCDYCGSKYQFKNCLVAHYKRKHKIISMI